MSAQLIPARSARYVEAGDRKDNGLSGSGSIWIGFGPIRVGVSGSTPELTNDGGDFGSNEWGANIWIGNGVPLFGWGRSK